MVNRIGVDLTPWSRGVKNCVSWAQFAELKKLSLYMTNQGRARGIAVCAALQLVFFAFVAHAQQSAPAASAASAAASAIDPLESFRVLAISVSEGVAVVRAPNGRLVTLTSGASLPTARARLVQVMADRLQFEVMLDKGQRENAWMFRGASANDPTVVQRWTGQAPPVVPVPNRGVSRIPSTK